MGILKKPVTHLLLIAAFGLVAYASTFHVPFLFDDKPNIVANPLVKELGYYVSPSRPAEVTEHVYRQFKSRFVGYLTLALNYKVHGFDVTGYHVFNLLVHLLNGALVYILVLTAFRTPFFQEHAGRSIDLQVAFFSGLLFVSHPIQTQAVTYIVQRFTSLAALFYLASFLAYVKFRLSGRQSRRIALYALALAFAVLSLKTKEFAVTLPITIVLFELCFFRDPLRKRILYLAPLVSILVLVPLSYMEPGTSLAEVSKVKTSVSRLDYLFTQFTVIVMYIRLLAFPANQNFDYDYPLYDSFFSPAVMLSFLFLASIAAVGVFLFIRSRSRAGETRLVAFGIFWFFITMAPESSLIPIVDIVFEHRVYLPSVGAFVAVAAGLFAISNVYLKRIPQLGRTLTALLMVIAIILCAATYRRNLVWETEASLWEDTVSKSPLKARPHYNLGTIYADKGQTEEAIEHLNLAVELDPGNVEAYNNLGNAYVSQGLLARAIRNFERAVSIDPDFFDALYNLGNAYGKIGQTAQAIKHYRRTLEIKPGHVDAHINLGNAYFTQGMTEKAIEHYRRAAALRPDFAPIHVNLGNAYLSGGQVDAAIDSYTRALRMDPGLRDAHYYLGIAFTKKGMSGKADEHFRISGRRPGS